MPTTGPLPAAFDPDQETDRFLAGVKKRAATQFSWKKRASLESAVRLAYWLFVFGKEDQALAVCRFLGTYEFTGKFNLWSWIEHALALQSRIARQRGRQNESAECVRRIRAAGFVESRLNGSLLDDRRGRIRGALAEKDQAGERDWSLTALLELCVLIELGGSETWPVAALEGELQQMVTRLRALLEVA
jgi:hypothetical protein